MSKTAIFCDFGSLLLMSLEICTKRKVSVFRVCGKIRTRKTLNADTFHAAIGPPNEKKVILDHNPTVDCNSPQNFTAMGQEVNRLDSIVFKTGFPLSFYDFYCF